MCYQNSGLATCHLKANMQEARFMEKKVCFFFFFNLICIFGFFKILFEYICFKVLVTGIQQIDSLIHISIFFSGSFSI